MITQIKSKRNSLNEALSTLQIHPQLQIKLQLNRARQHRLNTKFTSIVQINSLQTSSYPFFDNQRLQQGSASKALISQLSIRNEQNTSPKKRSKRMATRLSSYQLYKEQQKCLKQTHSTKIHEWKTKYMTLRRQKERSNRSTINRSNSSSPDKNIKPTITFPINPIQDIVSFRPISQSQFRSTFIKTGQGKRKMVDNNINMRKLKTKIEFYSLSTIITEREKYLKTTISPKFEDIDTRQENNRIKKNQELTKMRTAIRSNKARFRAKIAIGDNIQCRPWSGIKQDFTNQLSCYI